MAVYDSNNFDYIVVGGGDAMSDFVVTRNPLEIDNAWKNTDWMRTYKWLGYLQARLYHDTSWSQTNTIIKEIDELMRKLEFMFRDEDNGVD